MKRASSDDYDFTPSWRHCRNILYNDLAFFKNYNFWRGRDTHVSSPIMIFWRYLEIIDDLHGSVENTNRRLIREDAHVRKVTAKSSNCGELSCIRRDVVVSMVKYFFLTSFIEFGFNHGGILRGGVHLPWDRFAPPLRIFAPALKSHPRLLGKVSMIDQSENLTFFGCLGSTLRKKVFL